MHLFVIIGKMPDFFFFCFTANLSNATKWVNCIENTRQIRFHIARLKCVRLGFWDEPSFFLGFRAFYYSILFSILIFYRSRSRRKKKWNWCQVVLSAEPTMDFIDIVHRNARKFEWWLTKEQNLGSTFVGKFFLLYTPFRLGTCILKPFVLFIQGKMYFYRGIARLLEMRGWRARFLLGLCPCSFRYIMYYAKRYTLVIIFYLTMFYFHLDQNEVGREDA